MSNGKRGERGLLSLEACIAVTIFMFLMLFMVLTVIMVPAFLSF